MEQQAITAFISYSWDSESHEQWVMDLFNKLRQNGIEAKMDKQLTQSSTINLNQMMTTNLQQNDFIIVVLTENYAERADKFQGGVGFESLLSMPILQQDPDKLILIMKHQGDFQKAFPFHLQSYYAIDFSNENKFEDAFKELLHRIYKEPLYEIQPLGEKPKLDPVSSKKIIQNQFFNIELPSLKRVTDKDIHEFMEESCEEIISLLSDLFSQVKQANSNFDFHENKVNNIKTVFTLYIDGDHKTGVKIWLGGMFNQNTIQLSYGRNINLSNDNSYNEMISHEVDDKTGSLKLRMNMNVFGNNDVSKPKEIVEEIWENNVSHNLN